MDEEKSSNEDTFNMVMPSYDLKIPASSDKKNTTWHSENTLHTATLTLPLPSLTVTAPTFDHASEHKFLYFPRKFSIQALRKLSGSSVSENKYIMKKLSTNYADVLL